MKKRQSFSKEDLHTLRQIYAKRNFKHTIYIEDVLEYARIKHTTRNPEPSIYWAIIASIMDLTHPLLPTVMDKNAYVLDVDWIIRIRIKLLHPAVVQYWANESAIKEKPDVTNHTWWWKPYEWTTRLKYLEWMIRFYRRSNNKITLSELVEDFRYGKIN